ncbi:hypothetical protein D3C75_1127730 [compost metagenome]
MDSGNQLCRTKRLADMVISAYRQGIHFVLLLYLGSQEYNAEFFIRLSYSATDLKAVYSRNHYIQ